MASHFCGQRLRGLPATARESASPRVARQIRARGRPVAPVAQAGRRHATDGGKRSPRPENVDGDFFVDHTCIDCDTCRWMAPSSFQRVGDMSAVTQQPGSAQERHAALQALLSCPTHSIHVRRRDAGELAAAQRSFPLPVPGCDHVFHCGYHAENSFGATSYFIQRPEGNVMVDAPRWNPLLAQRLRELGGVSWIFLTHRDDVGDHSKWAEQLGARRVIHASEANRRQRTDECEVQLEGRGPWALHGGAAAPDADVQLVFTPGHTRGCVSLLFLPDRALFTGDHLAYSARLGRLTVFRAYNWHSVEQQLGSAAALRDLDFLHLLPGHGRRTRFANAADRRRQLDELLAAEGYASPAGAGV